MADCTECDQDSDHLRECSYCGNIVCMSHHLPENHDCNSLALQSSNKRLNSSGPSTSDFSTRRQRKERVRKKQTSKRENRVSDRETVSRRPTADATGQVETTGYTQKNEDFGDSGPDVAPDGSIVESDTDDSASENNWPPVWQTTKIILYRVKNWVELIAIFSLIVGGFPGLYIAYLGAVSGAPSSNVPFGIEFGPTVIGGVQFTAGETMMLAGIGLTAFSWYLAHRLTRGSPATF